MGYAKAFFEELYNGKASNVQSQDLVVEAHCVNQELRWAKRAPRFRVKQVMVFPFS